MDNGTLLLASLEPCWLWWLILSALAFILGAILGCLLCRNSKRLKELEEENSNLKTKATNWEKDYNSMKYQHEEAEKDIKSLRSKLNSCEADKAVLNTKLERLKLQSGEEGPTAAAASPALETGGSSGATYADLFQEDNLQIIEGIGPKTENILKDAGLSTWALLAASDESKIRKTVADAAPNARIKNPKSWPEQARLANQGKWEELVEYQKFMAAGKTGAGSKDTSSKLEKMAMSGLGFSSNPEDLTVVEGIGPQIQGLLKDAGINTWQELSETEVSRLQDILKKAGDRFNQAIPDSWPEQAALAAKGQWAELQKLQDYLQGGIDKG